MTYSADPRRFKASSLLTRVQPSGISNLHELAMRMRASGQDIADLTTGEPDFDTPAHIREAAVQAIADGVTRYTEVDGTLALKRAVQAKFRRENGLEYTEDCIVVASGAKPLLAVAMRAVLDPGDEVVLATPCWPSHPAMVSLAGADPVFVATTAQTQFKLTALALSSVLTERSRLLVLCSPANPTGAVYTQEEIAALADVLSKWPRVLVLSDDIYEHVRFTGASFATIGQVSDEMHARTLTVNGVSKAYAMTGWRIGYGAGPIEWIQAIRTILTQTSGGPCSISQAAAFAALEGPQTFIEESLARYQRRRDAAVARLQRFPGIEIIPPDGSFYLMPDISGLIGRETAEGKRLKTSDDVSAYFLSFGVVCIPGSSFQTQWHVRLSIAVSDETLDKALDRIESACEALN